MRKVYVNIVDVSLSYLRYSVELYRVGSQGELAMEALRIMVVKWTNEYSSLAYKLSEANEKETKEKMDMFMVEVEKKSRLRFGIHKKRKENLRKLEWKAMTSLPC